MITEGNTEMLIQGSTSAIKAEIWCFPERHGITFSDTAYLEGPFSSHGKTLTTKFPFVRSQLGEHHAWKAAILEPVLWSPRMPAIYQLGGLGRTASSIGLRDIRIKGESFYWEDRRWVARAAAMPPLDALNRLPATYSPRLLTIVPPLPSPFLAKADKVGSPLIVDATQLRREQLVEHVFRLSSHVSVAMILLPNQCEEEHRRAAHSHVLLGTFQRAPEQTPEWTDFVAVPDSLLSAGWKPDRRLPIVATKECDLEDRSPDVLCSVCDQFQADLNQGADYAGLWLLPKASS